VEPASIQIIGRYSEEWVKKATEITARMRADNPSRNFGYIVGILKRWDKQGHMD
jgi:DNA replication protein DnaD